MTRAELEKVIGAVKCKVIGAGEAGNAGHRLTVAALARAFDASESAVLCEPSLARKTTRPPDVVLIDPEVGVHVFEVKGVSLGQVEAIEAGGQLRIRYATGVRTRSPVAQVRNAMFDVKDATARAYAGADVRLPFKYWVVFPLIRRSAWAARFGTAAFCPPEFLFADDLEPAELARRLGASDRLGPPGKPIDLCPLDQLACVWRAFGDTSVLYADPDDRPGRRADEGTLGEQFDEAAEAYKVLSDEQQELSVANWDSGPRLVRGVAGSGKTVVLANNLARRLERTLLAAADGLFGDKPARPRLLAVCFNRTLAPFLEKKINAAFRQRTGKSVPEGMVEVCSFNTLMWRLTNAGLWRYQSVADVRDIVRAMQYLGDLEQIRQRDAGRLAALAYDAIYVDEGQDFLEEEFRLLKELCRVWEGSEPNLYVFYDDAQNLYGRARPNWQALGINVRGGRSYVMTSCLRNTRPIVEATLNVLYGTCTPPHAQAQVPTREFGDLASLEQKGLIRDDGGFWRVKFAPREGAKPKLTLAVGVRQEDDRVVKRLRWLVGEQEVRPEDVLVLSFARQRVSQLADAVVAAKIPGVAGVHVAFDEKDQPLGRKGHVTLSTVASAKGYDAYCVLLASANEFPTDVMGRASFYVGCTRAIEYLEAFAYERKGLAAELEAVLSRLVP
jgi:hypothetical protein